MLSFSRGTSRADRLENVCKADSETTERTVSYARPAVRIIYQVFPLAQHNSSLMRRS